MKILAVMGTRPEAIKLAPVIHEIQRRSKSEDVRLKVCATAQHREMLDQMLDLFGIEADYDLDIMKPDQSPEDVFASVLGSVGEIIRGDTPDWVLVQGDTSTVAASALSAYYNRVRVGHVEAGLRSFDKWQPFPEEINRRIAGVMADAHFAPTDNAKNNLLAEGVPSDSIFVTGNTVIDAVRWVAQRPSQLKLMDAPESDEKLVLVTAHRRENFGQPLDDICTAIKGLAKRYRGEVRFVYAVHPNPLVRASVSRILADEPNVMLTDPLDYPTLIHLINMSHLVLTDSGGIQEEAPSLGKPVLVLREVTERPEGIEAGVASLVGTDVEIISKSVQRLIEDPVAYAKMSKSANPYGDGKASSRIVSALLGQRSDEFSSAVTAEAAS